MEDTVYTVILGFNNDNDECAKDFADSEKAIGWVTVNLIEAVEYIKYIIAVK